MSPKISQMKNEMYWLNKPHFNQGLQLGGRRMSLFDELTQGLAEAIDYDKEDISNVRLKNVYIEKVPTFNKSEVKRIRTNIGMTQKNFALIVGVSSKTVEAWESGKNIPSGSASRVLEIIAKDPVILEKAKIVSK